MVSHIVSIDLFMPWRLFLIYWLLEHWFIVYGFIIYGFIEDRFIVYGFVVDRLIVDWFIENRFICYGLLMDRFLEYWLIIDRFLINWLIQHRLLLRFLMIFARLIGFIGFLWFVRFLWFLWFIGFLGFVGFMWAIRSIWLRLLWFFRLRFTWFFRFRFTWFLWWWFSWFTRLAWLLRYWRNWFITLNFILLRFFIRMLVLIIILVLPIVDFPIGLGLYLRFIVYLWFKIVHSWSIICSLHQRFFSRLPYLPQNIDSSICKKSSTCKSYSYWSKNSNIDDIRSLWVSILPNIKIFRTNSSCWLPLSSTINGRTSNNWNTEQKISSSNSKEIMRRIISNCYTLLDWYRLLWYWRNIVFISIDRCSVVLCTITIWNSIWERIIMWCVDLSIS